MPSNPFAMVAAGYARARPDVHPLVIRRIASVFQLKEKVAHALDVGCGAGLSTRALQGIANECIGLEPAESMLEWRRETAPGAHFVAGFGEALPFKTGSIDLITAAGSLNYVTLPSFFAEARRVLRPRGFVIAYDFSPGRRFRDSGDLADWFIRFVERHPWPPGEAQALNPEILAELASGFRPRCSERFEIPLMLDADFYVEYMMTETNVAFAIRNGAGAEDIRSWCRETVAPVFGGRPREVLFEGYFTCLALE